MAIIIIIIIIIKAITKTNVSLTLKWKMSWTAALSRDHSCWNRVSQLAANRASAPGDDVSGGVGEASTRRVRENRNIGSTVRRLNFNSPSDTVNVGNLFNRPAILCLSITSA